MIRQHPLFNSYWDDKSARIELIDVPMYAVASFSTMLHTEGTLRGFLLAQSKQKWLRIHPTQEWYDIYRTEAMDDLQKFFDRYLREIPNDWESTPRVRHSILGFNCDSVIDRPESSYPPSYCKERTFYLDGEGGTLNEQQAPSRDSSASYQADSWDDDGAHFVHKFESYTELIGYSQAELWMSCNDMDDMDVYIICRKLAADGTPLMHVNIPMAAVPQWKTERDVPDGNIFKYLGPNGRLRASHRSTTLDPRLRQDQIGLQAPASAWHPHDSEEKIAPGQVVKLQIPLWPSGIVFQAGEALRFEIKGHEVTLPEFPALHRAPKNLNHGLHFVHTGPRYPSSITLSLA